MFSLLGRMLNFSTCPSFPPPLFHCCSFSRPSPSVVWEQRQTKGVCSLWRVLFRPVGSEELFLWKRHSLTSSFGRSPEQGLGLFPLIPSREGLGPNGNHLILICFAGQSKTQQLPALWLLRKSLDNPSFPSILPFSKENSSVLLAHEIHIRVEIRYLPFFIMNPYSQGVKSFWADTCKILTLMGI